ncbi:MAG: hypothetical protein K2K58_00390 [Muribaculaceae bacterium]|nr:hypothetical protein [Muribaculaceae bacterium]
MILKRSAIKHAAALSALILSMGMTACSSDDNEPAQAKPLPKGIALTIPLSETRAADDGFTLTGEQRNSLFIATYDNDGNLIETIVSNGKIDRKFNEEGKDAFRCEFDKIREVGEFGTVLSVYLPYKEYQKYKNGLKFAAVYLPEMNSFISSEDGTTVSFEAPSNLSDLYAEVENAYTLQLPEGDNGSVWFPVDHNENNIPMAGLLDITNAVNSYDPKLWNESNPMFLNNDPLQLERAMAKVIVEEGANELGVGHFSEVRFDTPNKGTLMASPEVWTAGQHVTGITPVGEVDPVTQTIIPTTFGATRTFEFYTFETLFDDDSSREIIHIDWKNSETSTKETKDVKFNYYPNFDSNGNDQNRDSEFGPDANCWKGILRNHLYHFTINRPEKQAPQINVKVEEWKEDRYTVRL